MHHNARAFVMYAVESASTFLFASSRKVLADFEMASLTVEEKYMVLSVLEFLNKRKRESL